MDQYNNCGRYTVNATQRSIALMARFTTLDKVHRRRDDLRICYFVDAKACNHRSAVGRSVGPSGRRRHEKRLLFKRTAFLYCSTEKSFLCSTEKSCLCSTENASSCSTEKLQNLSLRRKIHILNKKGFYLQLKSLSVSTNKPPFQPQSLSYDHQIKSLILNKKGVSSTKTKLLFNHRTLSSAEQQVLILGIKTPYAHLENLYVQPRRQWRVGRQAGGMGRRAFYSSWWLQWSQNNLFTTAKKYPTLIPSTSSQITWAQFSRGHQVVCRLGGAKTAPPPVSCQNRRTHDTCSRSIFRLNITGARPHPRTVLPNDLRG